SPSAPSRRPHHYHCRAESRKDRNRRCVGATPRRRAPRHLAPSEADGGHYIGRHPPARVDRPLVRRRRCCGSSGQDKRLHTYRILELVQGGWKEKVSTCSVFVKPSDGLEPSTPSLPWRCSTN